MIGFLRATSAISDFETKNSSLIQLEVVGILQPSELFHQWRFSDIFPLTVVICLPVAIVSIVSHLSMNS